MTSRQANFVKDFVATIRVYDNNVSSTREFTYPLTLAQS